MSVILLILKLAISFFRMCGKKRFHYTGHFSNQMLQIYIFVLNMTLLFEYFFTFTNCLMQT